MPKITNKQAGPASVYVGGVSMAVAPGEFIESDDFLESELKFYGGFPESFEVSGKATGAGDDAEKLKTVTAQRDDLDAGFAQLRELAGVETNADAFFKFQRDRDTLAEIAALFGTDEVDELNVKAAIERLIQDAAEKPAETADTGEVGSASDLASAIALLDDTNDEHWTQAGLPDISTLKTLTGGDVTRAMVDQLPEGDKRVRKV